MESEGDEASHQHPKRKKSTSSAPFSSTSVQDLSSEFPVLPADLISEILFKLPLKSLLKFKSVSKSWLGLISSDNKYYTRHRFMLGFDPRKYIKDCSVSSLLYDHVTRAIDLDFPLNKSNESSIKAVGSANGLICVVISYSDLFLWNPSIRKFKKLPSPRIGFLYMYRFGYELNDDYYKVVCLTQKVYDDDSHYNVGKIYSLKNNSWKRLDDFRIGRLSNQTEGELRFKSCLGVLGNDLSMLCHPLESHADVVLGPSFCMSSEGETLIRNDSVFMIYNPNDDSIRFPKVSNFGPLLEAMLFVESLIWPFVANGTSNATTSKDAIQMKTIM
ncbi:hypothetical protein CQW23_22837 [Capsicum baccatum]|uniref:F-box domain-containing protein n=1 Tax=Capsicum baccatum TaxID=33114 RepID=A0A2G2W216_CAPBA|nr:hypothetical protein CQW23_22837 [Capsicum baccatum]